MHLQTHTDTDTQIQKPTTYSNTHMHVDIQTSCNVARGCGMTCDRMCQVAAPSNAARGSGMTCHWIGQVEASCNVARGCWMTTLHSHVAVMSHAFACDIGMWLWNDVFSACNVARRCGMTTNRASLSASKVTSSVAAGFGQHCMPPPACTNFSPWNRQAHTVTNTQTTDSFWQFTGTICQQVEYAYIVLGVGFSFTRLLSGYSQPSPREGIQHDGRQTADRLETDQCNAGIWKKAKY